VCREGQRDSKRGVDCLVICESINISSQSPHDSSVYHRCVASNPRRREYVNLRAVSEIDPMTSSVSAGAGQDGGGTLKPVQKIGGHTKSILCSATSGDSSEEVITSSEVR
jgi:hypothetical protein